MAYLDHPDRPRRIGFTSYADGTPRFDPPDDPAPFEDGDAYEGEADPEAGLGAAPGTVEPLEAAATAPRLVAFSAAAVAGAALAFTGAYLIRSNQHPGPTRPQTPAPVAVAQAQPQSVAPASPEPAASTPQPAPPLETTAKPHPAAAASGPRHLLARLDCARPATRAQRMVCASPRLLALDRRMTRAYAEAKADGAPPKTLQREQVKWLMARERAARRSRGAVEHLYRVRLADLGARSDRSCADARPSLGSLTHWLLSVPRKVVSSGAGERSCQRSAVRGLRWADRKPSF